MIKKAKKERALLTYCLDYRSPLKYLLIDHLGHSTNRLSAYFTKSIVKVS